MTMQRVKTPDVAYIPSTAGSLYANPASTKTVIKGFTIHNGNVSTENVKLYVVPDSAGAVGTAGVSNIFLNTSLPASDTLLVELPYALVLGDTNDSIQGVTTTASKVTILIHLDQDA